ncbi:MAG: lipoyl synthase [Deltaproteobacteria bacterium]
MDIRGARKRLPVWARKRLGDPRDIHRIKAILRSRGLHTVCESARCPNIGECFSKPTATFMILGDACTRRCAFCGVGKGAVMPPDRDEPQNIAVTAKEMGLKHVVITSVTRDDLADGGADHFALTIRALKDTISGISVEVLTPDFKGCAYALKTVLKAGPDIFNHNLETVRSLYGVVRPDAVYERSLEVLERAKACGAFTKSGIMVGLGETGPEVRGLLGDLKSAGCDAVTIGQYLRPSLKNLEVRQYVPPEVFGEYEEYGHSIGIKNMYSGVFVRSSYNAEKLIGL